MSTTIVDGNLQFRIFDVAVGGQLILRDLTAQRGFVEDVW